MKTISRLVATAAIAVATIEAGFAQSGLGAACGCPTPVSSRAKVEIKGTGLADANGDIVATNTILTCDKVWILDDKIFVGSGKTLTIQPGTVVLGRVGPAADANALIVSRGGKIFAPGSESCPIVFTAELDYDATGVDGTYGIQNKGKWGGVILLGTATNNVPAAGIGMSTGTAGVGFVEGFLVAEPRIHYGAGDAAFPTADDNDNSGVMTYVSIRHGGDIVGGANEINGLTLGSVGKGTTLHHIEVVANLDDGIEWFGGTADLKYGTVMFNDDDGFDWDLGWKGRGQFWTVVKTDQTTASGGDNGFESDGDDGKIGTGIMSNPTIYNVTFVGSNNINGNATQKGKGIEGKEQTNGIIRNSIIANYQFGMNLANDNTRSGPNLDAYDNWLAGTFKIECNTFVGNTTKFTVQGVTVASGSADDNKFIADGNTSPASIAGFDFLHTMNVGTNVVSDVYDLIPSSNLATACTAAPSDGFFSPANYRGAFESGKKSWMSTWTIAALIDSENGLVACPTDVTGDGQTTNADLSQILINFGTQCD